MDREVVRVWEEFWEKLIRIYSTKNIFSIKEERKEGKREREREEGGRGAESLYGDQGTHSPLCPFTFLTFCPLSPRSPALP